MEKSLYIEILQYLYDKGINIKHNISKIVDKHYPLDKDYDSFERNPEIELYLRKMRDDGFINYHTVYIHDLPNQRVTPPDCPLKVIASITLPGFKFVTDFRRDNSTLETNKIISKQSRRQTIILIGALLISLISVFISWLNYHSTSENNLSKQYLLPSKELIEQLKSSQKQDTLLKNHQFGSSKNLPKKP